MMRKHEIICIDLYSRTGPSFFSHPMGEVYTSSITWAVAMITLILCQPLIRLDGNRRRRSQHDIAGEGAYQRVLIIRPLWLMFSLEHRFLRMKAIDEVARLCTKNYNELFLVSTRGQGDFGARSVPSKGYY